MTFHVAKSFHAINAFAPILVTRLIYFRHVGLFGAWSLRSVVHASEALLLVAVVEVYGG
jgi:hypothetical protein